ncbi:MAG: hypothetical protein KDK64_05890 [Chlamydiia bacterium]|nr:hypothetical protein [Chlamydiia bacterium]
MRLASVLVDELLETGIPSWKLEKEEEGVALHFLTARRPYIGKFILEMVSHLNPAEFSLKVVQDKLLLTSLHLEEDSPEIERVIYEIEWGVRSPYHAARILEMKALSMDEKRGLIQERILSMIRRFPQLFDYDLFSEMQQFFLKLSDQYFRPRSVKEVRQTLSALYMIRRKILFAHEKHPKRRHVAIRVKKRTLSFPLEQKEALEVTVGMNVLHENEVFKKGHLLKAIESILPDAKFVSGSEYHEKEEYSLHLITLEIEKEGDFEIEDIADLKRWLPRALKGKIEHLQRSLFMPRNEEEILRHVVTLGRELRFARDLPQLILSFEKQTEAHLVFTVILARILLPKVPPIEDALMASPLRPKVDRIKQLGMLRKKYPKEAAVFKVELPIQEFIRDDHSVDLYKARQTILTQMQEIFGEIRDYNGGMISKQNEVFTALEEMVGECDKLLLENFFHSLFPLEKRSFIDPKTLKTLFHLLVEKMQSSKPYLSVEHQGQFFIVGEGRVLESIQGISNPMISLDLEYEERHYIGFIGH